MAISGGAEYAHEQQAYHAAMAKAAAVKILRARALAAKKKSISYQQMMQRNQQASNKQRAQEKIEYTRGPYGWLGSYSSDLNYKAAQKRNESGSALVGAAWGFLNDIPPEFKLPTGNAGSSNFVNQWLAAAASNEIAAEKILNQLTPQMKAMFGTSSFQTAVQDYLLKANSYQGMITNFKSNENAIYKQDITAISGYSGMNPAYYASFGFSVPTLNGLMVVNSNGSFNTKWNPLSNKELNKEYSNIQASYGQLEAENALLSKYENAYSAYASNYNILSPSNPLVKYATRLPKLYTSTQLLSALDYLASTPSQGKGSQVDISKSGNVTVYLPTISSTPPPSLNSANIGAQTVTNIATQLAQNSVSIKGAIALPQQDVTKSSLGSNYKPSTVLTPKQAESAAYFSSSEWQSYQAQLQQDQSKFNKDLVASGLLALGATSMILLPEMAPIEIEGLGLLGTAIGGAATGAYSSALASVPLTEGMSSLMTGKYASGRTLLTQSGEWAAIGAVTGGVGETVGALLKGSRGISAVMKSSDSFTTSLPIEDNPLAAGLISSGKYSSYEDLLKAYPELDSSQTFFNSQYDIYRSGLFGSKKIGSASWQAAVDYLTKAPQDILEESADDAEKSVSMYYGQGTLSSSIGSKSSVSYLFSKGTQLESTQDVISVGDVKFIGSAARTEGQLNVLGTGAADYNTKALAVGITARSPTTEFTGIGGYNFVAQGDKFGSGSFFINNNLRFIPDMEEVDSDVVAGSKLRNELLRAFAGKNPSLLDSMKELADNQQLDFLREDLANRESLNELYSERLAVQNEKGIAEMFGGQSKDMVSSSGAGEAVMGRPSVSEITRMAAETRTGLMPSEDIISDIAKSIVLGRDTALAEKMFLGEGLLTLGLGATNSLSSLRTSTKTKLASGLKTKETSKLLIRPAFKAPSLTKPINRSLFKNITKTMTRTSTATGTRTAFYPVSGTSPDFNPFPGINIKRRHNEIPPSQLFPAKERLSKAKKRQLKMLYAPFPDLLDVNEVANTGKKPIALNPNNPKTYKIYRKEMMQSGGLRYRTYNQLFGSLRKKGKKKAF